MKVVQGRGNASPDSGEDYVQAYDDVKKQLSESLRRYQELYDLAPVSFVTLDRRGTIVGLNKAAARQLGFPARWLLQRPFLVFISRSCLPAFLNLLANSRRIPEHNETAELELSVAGTTVPIQLSIRSSGNDREVLFRLVIVDLTVTKAFERELKETLDNWYSLVQSAPDIIMTVDRMTKITFVNRPIWGNRKQLVVGHQLTDFISKESRAKIAKCVESAFAGRGTVCELSVIENDKKHWYSLSFGAAYERPSTTTTTTTTTTVTIRDVTLHRKNEESLRASREQLREFAARLDQVREDERTRVAREIHDELGPALTMLKMDLAWLQGRPGQQNVRKKIRSMIGDVDQTIECVRKIVSELRPSILDEMGLTAALEWQVAQFQERTRVQAVFECSTEHLNLPRDTAAALFRLVQEGLTNVMRHARARHVRVKLKVTGGILRIAVIDDGKGIGKEQINDRKSFGIVGMRERVHRIGGEFNIFSGPGRGTRLEIEAPLQ